jgi:hypothetical protein
MSTPHRPSVRPKDWKKAAPQLLFDGSSTTHNLPKLPVPKLEDTLEKLKDSLVPIAWTDEELNTVNKRIQEFASKEGPELHQRLLERAKEQPHWLEQWWDDTGYLGYRDSVSSISCPSKNEPSNVCQVVINVTYYCMLCVRILNNYQVDETI